MWIAFPVEGGRLGRTELLGIEIRDQHEARGRHLRFKGTSSRPPRQSGAEALASRRAGREFLR